MPVLKCLAGHMAYLAAEPSMCFSMHFVYAGSSLPSTSLINVSTVTTDERGEGRRFGTGE